VYSFLYAGEIVRIAAKLSTTDREMIKLMKNLRKFQVKLYLIPYYFQKDTKTLEYRLN